MLEKIKQKFQKLPAFLYILNGDVVILTPISEGVTTCTIVIAGCIVCLIVTGYSLLFKANPVTIKQNVYKSTNDAVYTPSDDTLVSDIMTSTDTDVSKFQIHGLTRESFFTYVDTEAKNLILDKSSANFKKAATDLEYAIHSRLQKTETLIDDLFDELVYVQLDVLKANPVQQELLYKKVDYLCFTDIRKIMQHENIDQYINIVAHSKGVSRHYLLDDLSIWIISEIINPTTLPMIPPNNGGFGIFEFIIAHPLIFSVGLLLCFFILFKLFSAYYYEKYHSLILFFDRINTDF